MALIELMQRLKGEEDEREAIEDERVLLSERLHDVEARIRRTKKWIQDHEWPAHAAVGTTSVQTREGPREARVFACAGEWAVTRQGDAEAAVTHLPTGYHVGCPGSRARGEWLVRELAAKAPTGATTLADARANKALYDAVSAVLAACPTVEDLERRT